ncbi:hypothetical protein FACS189452_05100 [Bacteroidia bacterium]|nr:hypothetical protein FACS189452_05100 [Bacteroidia bacterium]GHT80906.1 hypothetical protein FACS189467_4040 [Bacteroidia bacterium]
MKEQKNLSAPTEFLLYKDSNGDVKVEIYIFGETIWLTQNKIAQLFSVDRTVVNKHLKNIFESGELQREATCAKIAQVQTEGSRSNVYAKLGQEIRCLFTIQRRNNYKTTKAILIYN